MSRRVNSKRKFESNEEKPSTRSKRTLSSKLASLNSVETPKKTSENKENSFNHWLMKSEPESRIENGHEMKFGIEDLKANKDQITCWDGVRNYEARNHMKAMKLGQEAFFYHSNCKNPGLAGIIRICKEHYVDHTQFDSNDPHYDPKSDKNNPKWFMVDVKFVRDLKRFIPLTELKHYHLQHKKDGGPLANLSLFTRSRLSVQSIRDEEWDFILELENKPSIL